MVEPAPGPRRTRRQIAAALGVVLIAAGAFAISRGIRPPDEPRSSAGEVPRSPGDAAASGSAFTDVAAAAGLDRPLLAGSREKLFIVENIGSGVGVLDFDGDGLKDLLFASGGGLTGGRIVAGPGVLLYRQLPGGRFEETAAKAGIAFQGWATGVVVGDIENDGDPDAVIGTLETPLLLRNEGGRFSERAAEAGLTARGMVSSGVFLDYDKDGLLDLYLARYVEFDIAHPPNDGRPCIENGVPISCSPSMHTPLPHLLYRNLGSGRFEDRTAAAGMGKQEGSFGLGAASGDVDLDGWPDIYAANDTTANFLWHNLRGGRFEEVALWAGCALSENGQGQSSMGVDLADADGDGRPEVFVTNYSQELNAYYANLGGLSFADRTYASGLAEGCFLPMGWGTKFFDYDHDGRLDLFVVNGHVHPRARELNAALSYEQSILFYRGDGRGGFRRVDQGMGPDIARPRAHRGAAVADLDGDGDLDIVVTALDAPPALLMNRVGQARPSIIVRLRGVASNREGIGARVELEAGGLKQVREVTRGGSYLSSSDAAVHFGLGDRARAESLRVTWPSGRVDALGALEGGATYLIEEGGKVLERAPHRPAR